MTLDRLGEEARDIHADPPAHPIRLNRVGGVGLRVPVRVGRESYPAEVDLLVDLPEWRRGVDLSRQNRALYEALSSAEGPLELARSTAEALLERLDYASRAEVRVRLEGLRRAPPNGSYEPYALEAFASLDREGETLERIAVEVAATTACPCTQELLRTLFRLRGLESVGLATHTQRARFRLEVAAHRIEGIGVEELIEVVEGGASSPVRAVLRRPQEAGLVLSMLENALLAEDAVREIAFRAASLDLPDEATIRVTVRSQESVHAHDIFAELEERVGRIREIARPGGE